MALNRFLGALIVGLLLAGTAIGDEVAAPSPAVAEEGRLDVSTTFSSDGGRIFSRVKLEDGAQALHGVQVLLDSENRLREYVVFNRGVLESRTQFYPNGKTFRFQHRERNGDGHEVVYASEAKRVVAESVQVADGTDIGPILTQEVIAQGSIKAGRRWDGSFLLWERVSNEFGLRPARHEYRNGAPVKRDPLDLDKLPLPG